MANRIFVIGLLLIGFLHNSFAAPQEEMISDFWKLDKQSQNIMTKLSNWSEQYKTAKVITAASSGDLKELIRDVYKLAVSARKLKRKVVGIQSKQLMAERFEELYGQEEGIGDHDLFQLLIGTLTDLVMYEQMSFFYHLAAEDKELKKRLDEVNVYGLRNHFGRLEKAWMSVKARKTFAKSLENLEKHSGQLDQMKEDGALYLIAMRDRLDTNLALELKKSSSFWKRLGQYLKSDWKKYRARAGKRLNWMEYHISKIFGNAAGSLNIQKFLKSIPKEELKRIRTEILQPGDVIVEKTAGAITDKFIPGHFGHVAVYFGRKEQLEGLKLSNGTLLLDHPKVKALLPRIEAGESTVEAIRPGTNLENIEHWTITDLAVLRPVSYPRERLGDVLLKSIEYVDTIYDFAFDVNTREIIVCSELPYQVFKGINFRVAKSAGRWTISPDDVAVLGGPKGENTPNRPFQLIYFNHETKVVKEEIMFGLYKQLLEAEKSRYKEVPENNHQY